jgi:pimeloyl-ACP methyl ester carboxylesterase
MNTAARDRILAAFAAATTVMAFSCAGDDAVSPPASTSLPATTTPPATQVAAATTIPDPTFRPTTTAVPTPTTHVPPPGRLVERPCDVASVYTADCYWLEVPERRDIPDARTIRLWVAVIHHDRPRAAPTARVHLSGGPGFPASTGWVAGTIELDPRDSRTIVVVDERGTGRSKPHLACPEFDDAIPTTAPYEDRRADHRRLAAACRQRLESDGVDLDGYDTVESAADFVDLRRALGYNQFVVRGVSYGARLAREIYRQDPAGVAGLLLDSPLTTAPAGPASLMARAEDAIDRLAAACAAQPACAASGSVKENLAAAAARLDHEPYPVPPLLIDGGVLHFGTWRVMYFADIIPTIPATLAAVAAGDNTGLNGAAALFAPAADPRDNFAAGMNEVVLCADEGAAVSAADRAAKANPGVWEDLLLGFFPDCDAWDVTPVDSGRLRDPRGDVPVLVLSGGLDPVTPPAFVDEVRRQFPSTTVVTVPAGGHALFRYDDCIRAITLAFTANPTAPLDTTCTAKLPAPFAPPDQ